MMVNVYKLAAKAFADEVPGLINQLDMKSTSEMMAGLEVCLHAMRDLRTGLVTFPNNLFTMVK